MVDVQWTERTTTDRIFSWIIQSIQRRKSSGTTDRHRTTTTIEWKTDGSCSRWTEWRPTLGQSTRIRTRLGSTTTTNLHLDSAEIARMNQKTRNRIANRRRRGKRYRFEVIRQIYPSFTITKLKRILKSINITYVNINIVRQTLYIGLKDKELVDETEKLLHKRVFTEQHYRRLYLKIDGQKNDEPKWPCGQLGEKLSPFFSVPVIVFSLLCCRSRIYAFAIAARIDLLPVRTPFFFFFLSLSVSISLWINTAGQ